MIDPDVSHQDLRLISAVITAAMSEAGLQNFSCSAATRLVFRLVAEGEHDFEVLKCAALMPPNYVIALGARRIPK